MSRDTAIVTGGGQGLGARIVQRLHAAGFNVVVADIADDAASELAARLDPTGATATAANLDVRDQAAFERVLAMATARWGSVEALVNNAAVTIARPVLDISPEEFDAVLAVNVRGTFVGSQVFGRYFKTQGYGRIVNMGSLAAQNGGAATGAHYAASKGAILTLTKVFARDLASSGITVNAVAPGPLDLPNVHALLPADKLAVMIGTIPVGQLGDPGFIADVVALLASREASSVTGATFDLNGGLFMR